MSIEKSPAKEKIPKPKKIISKTKKSLIIGAIVAAVAIAGIVGGIIFIEQIGEEGGTCVIGLSIGSEIEYIDPLTTSFEASIIPQQVAETLFDYDFSGRESRLIFTLATGYNWSDNATELICYLREGVTFHDGTPFNATAVKWNFDRMYHLVNTSLGSLEFSNGYLLVFPDDRWILNETQVIDEYTVKFVLNDPFLPFLQLLTHEVTSILSPTSTPFDDFLNYLTEKIVGTGPFRYDEYTIGVEIKLSSNPNYWGIKPKIDGILIRYYETTDDLWNAFLAQNVTLLHPIQTSLSPVYFPNISLEMLKTDSKFVVQESLGTNARYLGMNNININLTMRKAISYAINYSVLTEDLFPLVTMRTRSPIPEGILYYNTTAFDIPNYDISYARQILIDELGPVNSRVASLTANDNITADNEWEKLVTDGNPIAIYNISYMPQLFHSLTAPVVKENLKQIGIDCILIGKTQYPGNHLFLGGWLYDYNDPHNVVGPIFHSKSSDNFVNLNDSLIDQWIEEGMIDTDPISRKQTYFKIQERLIEELYVAAWTFTTKIIVIYNSNLRGFEPNPLFKFLLKTLDFV